MAPTSSKQGQVCKHYKCCQPLTQSLLQRHVVMCHAMGFAFRSCPFPSTHHRSPKSSVCTIRACKHQPSPAVRHFVNLTNGIEGLNALSDLVPANEIRFTRIQSSHAEASAYDKILRELDHDLLWSLANGHRCYLYDFASRSPRRGVPRSIFLSAEFIKWALLALWFGVDDSRVPSSVLVRGKNLVRFWKETVLPSQVSKETKKRARYYKPFAIASNIKSVDLRAVYGRSSTIDGEKKMHVELARRWFDTNYESQDSLQNANTPDNLRYSSEPDLIQNENHSSARMKSWMKNWRLTEFDSTLDADELRRIQAWMKESPPIWTLTPQSNVKSENFADDLQAFE